LIQNCFILVLVLQMTCKNYKAQLYCSIWFVTGASIYQYCSELQQDGGFGSNSAWPAHSQHDWTVTRPN
jgi:hypothetical protein